MNNIPDSKIEELIGKIECGILQINKQDLTALTDIMTMFSDLGIHRFLPSYVTNIAIRASRLAETMIMDDAPFDSGCDRLKEAIKRIKDALKSNQNGNSIAQNKDSEGKSIEASEPYIEEVACLNLKVNDDAIELVDRFIANQQSVLEDLEEKALSLEKGSSNELAAIKRILHTMKGEFGALNLQPYASLIHNVEAFIDRNEFTSDNMLRLKDILGKKLLKYNDKCFPTISKDEVEFIFTIATGAQETKKETEEQNCFIPASTIGNLDPSLLNDFIIETKEHLNVAENHLLEIEIGQSTPECINTVFRACHTIKGVAGFLNLDEIAKLAHSMENLMDLARQNRIEINSVHADLLISAMDCLKEFIANLEKYSQSGECRIPQNYTSVLKKLKDSVDSVSKEKQPERKLIGEILIEKADVSEQTINEALTKQNQGDPRKLGQILVEDENVSEKKIEQAIQQQSGNKVNKAIEETIRVPVTRLDQLIDAIGEAVIAQSMINADSSVRNSTSQGLQTKINQANMIMRQIQELSMSLRMVSIKPTFQKMARLVRDLSKKSGKQVEFVMEGEETEIDKTVVENIGDPLIHMIRNSMDHGIETEEERRANGKTRAAAIVLKAYHKAGSIFIEIRDNGRGLDNVAIYNKAVERGLCTIDDKLSDQQIYDFIFEPGFSTAKQITDISGRGVGMDVVKKNIDALRGSVEIQTEKNIGTTFIIRLPLTLAIIDGMIVRVGKALYIVPTLSIIETIAAREDIISSVMETNKMIKVRDNYLPLMYLSQMFDNKIERSDHAVALIVEDTVGKRAALMADEIIGQQQVVIKNLGNGVMNVPGITGGAIMSDGNVSLILDINGIIRCVMEK